MRGEGRGQWQPGREDAGSERTVGVVERARVLQLVHGQPVLAAERRQRVAALQPHEHRRAELERDAAVGLERVHPPADPPARLEHHHAVPEVGEAARRRDPGEAGADDDDAAPTAAAGGGSRASTRRRRASSPRRRRRAALPPFGLGASFLRVRSAGLRWRSVNAAAAACGVVVVSTTWCCWKPLADGAAAASSGGGGGGGGGRAP